MSKDTRRDFNITLVVSAALIMGVIILVANLGLGMGLLKVYGTVITLVALQAFVGLWQSSVTMKAEDSRRSNSSRL